VTYTFQVSAINSIGTETAASDASTPVTVGPNAIAVSAGNGHSCALLPGGTASCWGLNHSGELGDGTYADSTTPVTVTGLTTAAAITTGGDAGVGQYSPEPSRTCARLDDGTVKCWGYGPLGNGTTFASNTPVTVSGITTAIAVAAASADTCAVLADGTVQCWGNGYSAAAANCPFFRCETPMPMSGITTATAITGGYGHLCVLLTDGTVKCWGTNGAGQLGNGTTTDQMVPVTVTGISTAIGISAGYYHTCALMAGGTVKCWGAHFINNSGQLGDGTLDGSGSTVPVSVTDISTASAIAAGGEHTCAVLTDGTAKCWGSNRYGQVGYGGSIYDAPHTPVSVTGITTAIGIDAGAWHTCALLARGDVKCWGRNTNGQLGNGSGTDASTPVALAWP
jgi:alpha-tubulin suppressor-like RCC1 family protein